MACPLNLVKSHAPRTPKQVARAPHGPVGSTDLKHTSKVIIGEKDITESGCKDNERPTWMQKAIT